jgi:hypothetical protein
MDMSMNQLDHIVIAHPNLDLAIEEFADLTGCTPAYGGPHLGGGTHNALVSLGDSVYLELISPDPGQVSKEAKSKTSNLAQRIAASEGSKLLAWAVRSNRLDEMSGALHGFDAARPFDMSRQQPDGETLNWRLMNLVNHDLHGFAPFFIDWLDCAHPTSTNPVAGEFISLSISHPDSRLNGIVGETGNVSFTEGTPNFTLEFESKKGTVALSSQTLGGFWA